MNLSHGRRNVSDDERRCETVRRAEPEATVVAALRSTIIHGPGRSIIRKLNPRFQNGFACRIILVYCYYNVLL